MNLFCYRYPRPMVTVDAVVFSELKQEQQIALIRRKNDPFAGSWALPGGFLDMDESLDAAVARELKEETGLVDIPLRQFHSFGDLGRDPRGRSISVAYLGFLAAPAPLCAADDACDAAWFPVDKLPGLAFDHDKIISLAQNFFKGIFQ
ncbi:MAG: NUDIX hydrolase [Candidatus Hydrogenedentes bacterium]|jgi:8-oxo-dGTP diphosphatase|nr:NUDIX hydrolase [Candidatus Hydrogenedentota bacterium]